MNIEPSYWLTGDNGDSSADVTWHFSLAQRICDINNAAEQELQTRDKKYYDPDWTPSKPEPLYSQRTIEELTKLDKDLFSTLLWLYRRLPRGYNAPPHINVVVRELAKRVGHEEDAEEIINERKDML